jgi:GT2 family glycosyltransferase
MNKNLISIVIVNYNVKDLILACIESLYLFFPKSFNLEIIVVDNYSIDGSVEAIRGKFSDVIVIANKINIGFPAANNQAFKIAKGDYLFMLNPDTALFDDSLSRLFNYLKDNPDVDIVAPMLINSDKSRQSSIWRFPTLWYLFCEMNYLSFLIPQKSYSANDYDHEFQVESCS